MIKKIKQYFCNHSGTETKDWLEKNSIVSQTSCLKCGKSVPTPFASGMSYCYQIDLLEKAKHLKEGEKLSLPL